MTTEKVSHKKMEEFKNTLTIKTKYLPSFVKELDRADGYVVAITGTTSGTGYAAAKVAAELGAEVLLLNRSSSRAEKALASLKEEVPQATFVPITCDLQSFASVRAAVAQIKAKYDKLNVLCNNAGIALMASKDTEDGFDVQMQTNHLSHFLLTKELMPLLEAAAQAGEKARVVNHSSEARKGDKLERKYFESNSVGKLGGDETPWHMFGGGPFHRYHHSKLANVVFTHGLAQRLNATGSKVKVLVAHPGGSATSLTDHFPKIAESCIIRFMFRRLLQTAEDGAMGILKCMFHPNVASSEFYGPTGLLPWSGLPNKIGPYKVENDPESIELLWAASEEAIGESFTL